MSRHPNAMLLCCFTKPEGTQSLLGEMAEYTGSTIDDDGDDGGENKYISVEIGGDSYTVKEYEEYDEDAQIQPDFEGQLVAHYLFTYGYGETEAFDEVARKADSLKAWADGFVAYMSEADVAIGYTVKIGANYW